MLWRRGSGRLQAAPRSARRSVNGVATVVARVWSGLVVRRLNHRPRAHSSVLRAAPVFEPRCVGTFRPLFPRCVQSLPRRLLHVPRRLLHIHAHAYPEKIRYDCWVSHATRLARSAVPLCWAPHTRPALLTAVRNRRSGLALHPPEGYYTAFVAPDWRGGIRVGRTSWLTQ
eukprot:scaffold63359_cov78-Phaeocystis_antarctica.AAC.6